MEIVRITPVGWATRCGNPGWLFRPPATDTTPARGRRNFIARVFAAALQREGRPDLARPRGGPILGLLVAARTYEQDALRPAANGRPGSLTRLFCRQWARQVECAVQRAGVCRGKFHIASALRGTMRRARIGAQERTSLWADGAHTLRKLSRQVITLGCDAGRTWAKIPKARSSSITACAHSSRWPRSTPRL